MNILLAEDDLYLGELIVHMLKKKVNYKVTWVKTGNEAMEAAFGNQFDVLILDWMMPEGTGIEVCRNLRNEGYTGAILILTAKDSLQDKVEGLEAGADDYLIKPFEIDELIARLRALSRRNYAPIIEEIIKLDDMAINRSDFTIYQDHMNVQLTPREFQLLDLLIKNKGQVIPREVILERVWGFDTDVSTKTVDATVKLLRKKLDIFNKQDMIQSIRGVGYKLEV